MPVEKAWRSTFFVVHNNICPMTNNVKRIVVLDAETVYPLDDVRWQPLLAVGNVELYACTEADKIVERCAGADAVLTNKVPFDAASIAALPQLKYIGVLATGFNIIDLEAARAAGIVVTNIPSYSTRSVAQHAIALLLAASEGVEAYADESRRGLWAGCPLFTYLRGDWHELAGKYFGVAGFGNIGSATAAIAAALGMNVVVYTSKNQNELPQGYIKADNLDDLVRRCDVVSLHCPLTAQTRNMIDSRRLALMQPSAILINTARGPLVDESAVAVALHQGRLGAYCADVMCQEPPQHDNPLFSAPRTFITPHIAWASVEARRRLMEIAVSNVIAWIGGTPRNRVGL